MPDLNIGVLEKAESLGEHNLSGAVVNPRAFRELFPDLQPSDFPFRQPVPAEAVYFMTERRAQRIPTPPTMHNSGFYTASICEIVRWLGERAEALGVNLFAGFPVDALLVDGTAVRGVRTTPSAGSTATGQPGPSYAEPTDLTARVTVVAEGTRGLLGQAWREWQKVGSANPQIFALGVKELWEVKRPLERGDPHARLAAARPTPSAAASCTRSARRRWRSAWSSGSTTTTPASTCTSCCSGSSCIRCSGSSSRAASCSSGAPRRFPRAGTTRCPQRRSGDGVLFVGDTAGYVDVPSLKGIHYAMQSGMYAARAAFAALKAGEPSAAALAAYDRMVNDSYIVGDMYRTRNMRLAFKDGLYLGGLKAGLMTVTGGRFPGGRIEMPEDARTPRTPAERREAVHPRRHAHLRQARRGVQVGQRHPRHDPLAPHRREGRERRGRGLLRPRVPGRRVRARGRRAPGQRAQLRGLQGHRRARAAMDTA